ncbi:MAG: BamA/TamA family outer membrane protein [Planctomycetota bacterium]
MSRLGLVFLLFLLACQSSKTEGEGEEAGPPPLPVELTGQEGVSERDLRFAARRELSAFQKRGRRAADAFDAAYAMELELRRRGYAHGSVRFELLPSEEAPENLRFTIEEGPLARIALVAFPDKTELTPEELGTLFPQGERPLFRQSEIDSSASEVEKAFLLAGFRDVEVGPVTVTFNDAKTEATITVPVQQGDKYLVREVKFEGDAEDELEQNLRGSMLDQPFYSRLPAEAAALLRAALFDLGYHDAKVSFERTFDVANVTITIFAERGTQYRVREVRIEGNDRTRPRFVKSRVDLEKGDVLSQGEIDRSVGRLYETGVFRSVRMRPDARAADAAEADLLIELQELEARSISFDVGWGSYELLRGGVRYQDRNFLGFGRRLDLALRGSTVGYSLEGAISDNFLLGRKNTLTLSGQLFQREEPSFTRFGYRIALTLTHQYNEIWTVRTGYEIDAQEARDIQSVVDFEEGEFLASAGLFASVERDTRETQLVPGKGSILEFGAFWSNNALGADLNYVELRISWFGFFRLSERIVLGTGFRAQSRPITDDAITLPIQKRLFLGGATTVRSFEQDELGPTDPITGEPIGGLTRMSAHVELRTRIWNELHLATFYEVGMVSTKALSVDGPPGHGVGAGLRYYLPVGPIRVDVAYNPGELFAGDSRWVFHFAFGFSF